MQRYTKTMCNVSVKIFGDGWQPVSSYDDARDVRSGFCIDTSNLIPNITGSLPKSKRSLAVSTHIPASMLPFSAQSCRFVPYNFVEMGKGLLGKHHTIAKDNQ